MLELGMLAGVLPGNLFRYWYLSQKSVPIDPSQSDNLLSKGYHPGHISNGALQC